MSPHTAKVLLNYVFSTQALLLLGATFLVFRSRAFRQLPFFGGILTVNAVQVGLDVALLFHRQALGIPKTAAYPLFFYSGWVTQLTTSLLIVCTIYSVFQILMKPLQGLRRMGTMVFVWVGGIAACLACVVLFGPHLSGNTVFATVCGQFQEAVSVLTLCLLLAVTMATRPLGLTFRSRVFGVTLGLGISTTSALIESSWFATEGARDIYAPFHLIGAVGGLVAVIVWVVYFVRPEPARRMIMLPTTSPFFFWNRIAEALGDAPGQVAVGGISPDMFAPAELLAFRANATVVEMPHAAQR